MSPSLVTLSPQPKCVRVSHLILSTHLESPLAITVCLPFTASILEGEVYANGLRFLTSHLLPHPPQPGFCTHHPQKLLSSRPKVHPLGLYASLLLSHQRFSLLTTTVHCLLKTFSLAFVHSVPLVASSFPRPFPAFPGLVP